MAKVINQTYQNPEVQAIAARCQGGNEYQKIANFAFKHAYFEPDPPKTQIIRTPAATLRTKRANCVDYTVLIGAVAKALGRHVIIRICQLPGQNNYGHVYPVVDGYALDIVPGQNQYGQEIFTRRPGKIPVIGKELESLATFDTVV